MPEFLEKKLKKQYGAKSKVPYMVMNKLGAMRGNKETSKGKMMEKKHQMKVSSPLKGLGGPEPKRRKKKKKEEMHDPFASAMSK